jgi:crossover junction endodeoxyribonuclease RusA
VREVVLLFVFGTEPAPQGSKKHVGGGRLIESSKKVGPWRSAVALAVKTEWNDRQELIVFDEAVRVDIQFFLPRPKTVKRPLPIVPPDVDKLIRSTLDGLVQGGLLRDDSIVTTVTAVKAYADARPVGATIAVSPVV